MSDDSFGININFHGDGFEKSIPMETLESFIKLVAENPDNAVYKQCLEIEMKNVVDMLCNDLTSDDIEAFMMQLNYVADMLCASELMNALDEKVSRLIKVELGTLKKIIEMVSEKKKEDGKEDE